jgi:hypothetical protein
VRALVIIEADSSSDFDAVIRTARASECVKVVVLDENWDFPEHENLKEVRAG